MTIEIVPAGSTAVVTDKHESRHPDRWDLSTEMQRDLIENTNRAERLHSAETVQATLSQQELASGFAEALVDSAKNQAASQLEAEKNTNQLGIQATGNFNLSSVQAVQFSHQADVSRQKFAYEGQLQAQVIGSARELSAQLIASVAAAKAAECCCELKTAIHAEGERTRDDNQKTRELVSAIQMQDLRDSRTKLEIAYASLFAAKVAPVAPVV